MIEIVAIILILLLGWYSKPILIMKARFKIDPSVQSIFSGSISSAHTSPTTLEFNFQLDTLATIPDPDSIPKPLYGDYSNDIASGD